MSLARTAIARMEGYVPGEQPRGRTFIKLNTNENPYPPSPRVAAALRAFDPARLRLYSEPLSLDLRDTAAQRFGLTRDWAICGNGSDDLLTIAMRTFVDQGAKAAYMVPSYSLYPVLADLQGAEHVPVNLDADFSLPVDAAAQAAEARLVLVARPNAPTGNAFPLEDMHALCRDVDGVVWIDEAYVDFADDHCVDLVRTYPNVVVSRTLSKSYSLAGIRLGIAFANPDLITEMLKVKDSYNVNMLTQILGRAALEDDAYVNDTVTRIKATRKRTAAALTKLGFRVLPSQANFLLTEPPIPAAEMLPRLREEGILVRHFSLPRIRQYLRISIGTDDQMDALLQAVQRILDS